jgi:hypothetical protein
MYFLRGRGIVSGSIVGTTQGNPASSAQEILSEWPSAPSGSYWIDWGGSGSAIKVHCEMTLEGGGWMMILNYVHSGGTNPDLLIRTTDLPLLGSEYSFGDESSSTGQEGTWGHASNSMAAAHPWTEYMFYAKTSAHSRQIHFRGSVSNVVNYIKTGSGSMSGIGTRIDGSLDSANLPAGSLSYFSNKGDLAMTDFPYYVSSNYHWGIKGLGNRWEVDDYPNNSANSTIHRIWVR